MRPSAAARARADEIVSAFDTWQKRRDRRPRGYRAAERAMDAAGRRLCDLERKICSTRARSLAGLIAKARLGREVGDEDRFGAALIADLLVLAGEVDGRNHHRCRRRAASPAILVAIREPTEDAMSGNPRRNWNNTDRRDFIGGSDARIIMGQDGKASIRVHRRLKNPHKR